MSFFHLKEASISLKIPHFASLRRDLEQLIFSISFQVWEVVLLPLLQVKLLMSFLLQASPSLELKFFHHFV